MLGHEAGGKLLAETYPNGACKRRRSACRGRCEKGSATAVLRACVALGAGVGAWLRFLLMMAAVLRMHGLVLRTGGKKSHRGGRHAAQGHEQHQQYKDRALETPHQGGLYH